SLVSSNPKADRLNSLTESVSACAIRSFPGLLKADREADNPPVITSEANGTKIRLSVCRDASLLAAAHIASSQSGVTADPNLPLNTPRALLQSNDSALTNHRPSF